jgi:hypothetical protein
MSAASITLGIWAAVGPLVGIALGHFLTRSWQHKQWLLDRRKEEWRELLTALADSLRSSLKIYPARALSGDEEREIVNAHADAFRVIRDRIYIAADVKLLDLENRWSATVEHHSQTLDAAALGRTYDVIRLEIVKRATERR